ncbi:MAG TPA: hypothetical protein VGT02_07025 [Methylomirabilota bacterium]|nr:hypothetical protein [Methylomirabilota bacterium]
MPGPPNNNESYVISIQIPGPLTAAQVKKLNKAVKTAAQKIHRDATCTEQKLAPKR